MPTSGVTEQELADVARAAGPGRRDSGGPVDRVLAKEKYGVRERELVGATLVAFTAQARA